MITFFAKISGLLLLAATKFLFAPGMVRAAGFNFWESIFICILGGWTGIFIFYFVGKWVTKQFDSLLSKKNKKKFTRMNRFVIRIKTKFGLLGIAILTPCILSIPIGCILASKYFRHNNLTLTYLLVSLVSWAFILNSLVYVVEFDFLMNE